jgi:hypothetical protein
LLRGMHSHWGSEGWACELSLSTKKVAPAVGDIETLCLWPGRLAGLGRLFRDRLDVKVN